MIRNRFYYLFIHLSIHPSIYLFIHLFIYLFIYPSITSSIDLSYSSIYPFIYLYTIPSAYLSDTATLTAEAAVRGVAGWWMDGWVITSSIDLLIDMLCCMSIISIHLLKSLSSSSYPSSPTASVSLKSSSLSLLPL